MPSSLLRAILIFALLVVAVVSWQWIEDHETEPQVDNNRIEMVERQSDYYLEGFEIINVSNNSVTAASDNAIVTGTQAGRQVTITGQSLSHHYSDGYSVIEYPVVRLNSAGEGQWHAKARTGTVSPNFDVLDLLGDVQLTHTKPANDSPITVSTQSLSIDNGNRTLASREPVQVTGNGWQYSAASMEAEIDQGVLSFASGVEAQFESPDNR